MTQHLAKNNNILIASFPHDSGGNLHISKILVFITRLITLACLLCSPMIQASGLVIGEPAPNLIGRTLDDKPYRLKTDTGQIKVINFFSVDCKPCRQEMPELAKLETQYNQIKFIAVHTKETSADNIQKFIQSLPGAPTHIVQTSGGAQEVFKIQGLPHTLVLDAKNNVLLNLTGYTPANMQRLNQLLQKLAKQSVSLN